MRKIGFDNDKYLGWVAKANDVHSGAENRVPDARLAHR